ncbi:hypothetical protein Ndes2526B_g02883 [Nannochloris sp. 'desiccata']|nr:putative UPF0161 protein [Chlorella desiccata (nom. nud.)]
MYAGNHQDGIEKSSANQTEEQEAEHAPADGRIEAAAVEESAGVRIALNMLQFYKSAISPLLQPSCRFQPTCSAYSMDAYKKFGVAKGTLLTAWRLARCNPWGRSGYDPVKWPPPGFDNFVK